MIIIAQSGGRIKSWVGMGDEWRFVERWEYPDLCILRWVDLERDEQLSFGTWSFIVR